MLVWTHGGTLQTAPPAVGVLEHTRGYVCRKLSYSGTARTCSGPICPRCGCICWKKLQCICATSFVSLVREPPRLTGRLPWAVNRKIFSNSPCAPNKQGKRTKRPQDSRNSVRAIACTKGIPFGRMRLEQWPRPGHTRDSHRTATGFLRYDQRSSHQPCAHLRALVQTMFAGSSIDPSEEVSL